jgi:hypothetical protein
MDPLPLNTRPIVHSPPFTAILLLYHYYSAQRHSGFCYACPELEVCQMYRISALSFCDPVRFLLRKICLLSHKYVDGGDEMASRFFTAHEAKSTQSASPCRIPMILLEVFAKIKSVQCPFFFLWTSQSVGIDSRSFFGFWFSRLIISTIPFLQHLKPSVSLTQCCSMVLPVDFINSTCFS